MVYSLLPRLVFAFLQGVFCYLFALSTTSRSSGAEKEEIGAGLIGAGKV
jgi:hypothetical protein